MSLFDYCVAAVFGGPIVLGIAVILIKVFT